MRCKSVIPGVDWPALPNERGCQLLAVQFQLDRSQWLRPEEIELQQSRLARRLYLHALRHIPYYRQRYGEAGFGPSSLRGPELSPSHAASDVAPIAILCSRGVNCLRISN